MNKKKYDASDLKIWALFTMFIDHVGAVLIENTSLYSIESFQMLDITLRLIGRIAFPLYAFLLVEGFLHTSNLKKYIGRMAIFALVSEIPFDLGIYGELSFAHQNVFFTLLLGLLVMKGMEMAGEKKGVMFAVIIAGCVLARVINVDYSYMGVLLIIILYAFREEHKRRCIIGAVLFSYEITSIFAFLMMYYYTGKKGDTKIPKMVFYGFYPVHLLLLWGAATLFI